MRSAHIFSLLLASYTLTTLAKADPYEGSKASELWQQLESDPYEKPAERVTLRKFFHWGVNRLQENAQRTLSDRNDLLPYFDKLVHANGICLKGSWEINKDTKYTGYFKGQSRGIIIARASVALSETERGQYRGFGLAGKIFPTTDEDATVKTANFFTIDDLSGTLAPSYLDAQLTNEPLTSLRPSLIWLAPLATAASTAFLAADIHPGIRQLYEISEAGLASDATAVTPKWMRIKAAPGQTRLDEIDFRDELIPSYYGSEGLVFDVAVASQSDLLGNKDWQTIGRIVFTDSIVSSSCDHRLHFHHPAFRKDLNY